LAALAAEEKKASEIVVLDVALKSGVTDYFLICSAESERQVIAVKDHIEKVLDEKGYRLYGLEGLEAGVWVLITSSRAGCASITGWTGSGPTRSDCRSRRPAQL